MTSFNEFSPTDLKPFFFGGIASCVAEAVTFPIDTAKTRLQLQGKILKFIKLIYTHPILKKYKKNNKLVCLVLYRIHFYHTSATKHTKNVGLLLINNTN